MVYLICAGMWWCAPCVYMDQQMYSHKRRQLHTKHLQDLDYWHSIHQPQYVNQFTHLICKFVYLYMQQYRHLNKRILYKSMSVSSLSLLTQKAHKLYFTPCGSWTYLQAKLNKTLAKLNWKNFECSWYGLSKYLYRFGYKWRRKTQKKLTQKFFTNFPHKAKAVIYMYMYTVTDM